MNIIVIYVAIGLLIYAAVCHMPDSKAMGLRFVQWWPIPRLCPLCMGWWVSLTFNLTLAALGYMPVLDAFVLAGVSAITAHICDK